MVWTKMERSGSRWKGMNWRKFKSSWKYRCYQTLNKNYNHVIKFRKFHYEISAWNRTLWKDSKLANTWLKNFLWYSWWSLFSEKSSMKNHFRLKRMNEDKNGGHFLDYRIWKGPLMESWNYITRFISTYHLQMRMPSCRSRE